MATKRYYNSGHRRYAGNYIDGNVVRSEEVWESQVVAPRRPVDPGVQRNRERARSWDMPYVLVLLIATLITVILCYQYLQLQSRISLNTRQLTSLQTQVNRLKADNDAAQANLEIEMDLVRISELAISKLGMVYPRADQVIEYEKSESEYVRQYDEIPTTD